MKKLFTLFIFKMQVYKPKAIIHHVMCLSLQYWLQLWEHGSSVNKNVPLSFSGNVRRVLGDVLAISTKFHYFFSILLTFDLLFMSFINLLFQTIEYLKINDWLWAIILLFSLESLHRKTTIMLKVTWTLFYCIA